MRAIFNIPRLMLDLSSLFNTDWRIVKRFGDNFLRFYADALGVTIVFRLEAECDVSAMQFTSFLPSSVIGIPITNAWIELTYDGWNVDGLKLNYLAYAGNLEGEFNLTYSHRESLNALATSPDGYKSDFAERAVRTNTRLLASVLRAASNGAATHSTQLALRHIHMALHPSSDGFAICSSDTCDAFLYAHNMNVPSSANHHLIGKTTAQSLASLLTAISSDCALRVEDERLYVVVAARDFLCQFSIPCFSVKTPSPILSARFWQVNIDTDDADACSGKIARVHSEFLMNAISSVVRHSAYGRMRVDRNLTISDSKGLGLSMRCSDVYRETDIKVNLTYLDDVIAGAGSIPYLSLYLMDTILLLRGEYTDPDANKHSLQIATTLIPDGQGDT